MAENNKKHKGFTLIEIMIVVSIILLLGVLFMPMLLRVRLEVKEAIVEAELKSIHIAIKNYYDHTGKLPKSWDDLKDYISISKIEEKYELNPNLGGEVE